MLEHIGSINSYDVIIVGGGPSAAGLLHGLLLRLLDDSSVDDVDADDSIDDDDERSRRRRRRLGGDFRIAILERGTDNASDDNFDDDADGVDHADECKFDNEVTSEQRLVDFKLPLSAVGGNYDDNCDRRIIAPSAATTATTTMTTKGAAMQQQQRRRQQNQGRGGRFDHSHPSTFRLSHWFNAAHYTSSRATDSLVVPRPIYLRGHGHCHHQDAANDINDDDMKVTNNDNDNNFINTNNNNNNNTLNVSTPTPTVLHVTTPNGATNYRLLDIPMGCGWGGSTNIHAGLIMEPPTPIMGAAGAAADNVDGDDFMSWPGRWKGGKLLRKSMQDVKTVLLMNTDNSNAATTATTDDYDNKCSTRRCHEIMREDNNQANDKMSGNDEDEVDGTTNNYCSNFLLFQSVITSSSSNGGKRVNYFSVLVGSLIQEYPMLQQHVIFLPGTFVERILINRITGRAWGVECCRHGRHRNFKDCYQRIIVKSKGEIVLCAGAIGSPALLLASGIGHEDDLHIAGIVPWYENDCHCQEEEERQQQHQQSSASLTSSSLSSHQLIRTLPVGHNLRDHVLLPRVFVTSPLSLCYWCTTTWCGIVVPNNVSSYNTIQGTLSLNLPAKDSNDHASIQLQLADGSQMDYMIPHFAAGAVRRHWPLFFPSVFDLTTSTCIPILQIFLTLFHSLRSFLCLLLRLPPFNWLVSHHMSTLNVCLMNPQSVGKVTIVSTACQDDNNYDDDDDDNDDDDDHVRDMGCQRKRIKSPRLSNCRVLIDPGYLTSSRDVDALWSGWCASSDIIKRHRLFIGCVEVLPGSFINIVFSIFTLISYTTSRIAWLIGSHYYHDKNRNESNSSSSNSINDIPAWFSNYVAEFANPYYHWCGTCAMGGGEDDIVKDGKIRNNVNASLSSVVDENLCVRGIIGLRICDASVFPESISAPTALTCAALGYVAVSEIFDC